MIAVPVTLISLESENEATVDTVNLSTIVSDEYNWYWLTSDVDKEEKILYLFNQPNEDDANIIIDARLFDSDFQEEYGPFNQIRFSFYDSNNPEFVVPKNCSLTSGEGAVKVDAGFDYIPDFKITIMGVFDYSCYVNGVNVRGLYVPDYQIIVDGGTITANLIADSTKQSSNLDLYSITSDESSNVPLTINGDSHILGLSGTAKGKTSASYMRSNDYMLFDNLSISNLIVDLTHVYQLTMRSDLICGTDVKFVLPVASGLRDDIAKCIQNIIELEDMESIDIKIPIYTNANPGSGSYSLSLVDYFDATIDTSGIVQQRTTLVFFEQQGIKEIMPESDVKTKVVQTNVVFDLTSITVVCEENYSFDGWYYVNEFGVECKITAPTEFMPTNSVALYAKATYTGGGGGGGGGGEVINNNYDFSPVIIAILVIVAILAIVGIAVIRNR